MAQKKPVAKSKSPFWKPATPGEKIEGIFAGVQATTSPDKKKGAAFVLLLKNGTKLVPATYEIRSALGEIVPKMKAGKTRLAFTFLEKVSLGKGRSVKKFECYVDGKRYEASGGFETASKPSKIMDIWNSAK